MECKCGNKITMEHGKLEKTREGKKYILYYCTKCQSLIAEDQISKEIIYNYNPKQL